MGKHLVFYDGQCGLCDLAVQFLLKRDRGEIFDFAPLQGQTAKLWLDDSARPDTVVLVEDYKTAPRVHILSRAAFRALFLLGGLWTLPGLLYFLPPFCFDWAYRLVARNRLRLFSQDRCVIPPAKDSSRFLL